MKPFRQGTDYSCAKTDAIAPADYVNNLSLAAGVAKGIGFPPGARFLIVGGNEDFWVRFSGDAGAPVADVPDGTGSILISAGSNSRRMFFIETNSYLSAVSVVDTQISLEFFG